CSLQHIMHTSPISTYTTLIRSRDAQTRDALGDRRRADRPHIEAAPLQAAGQRHGLSIGADDHGQDMGTRGGKATARPQFPIGVGDRKSTRLNSSHVAISYAVFG